MDLIHKREPLDPVIRDDEQPKFPNAGPLEHALLEEVTDSGVWIGFRQVPAEKRVMLERVAARTMGYRYAVGVNNGTAALGNGLTVQLTPKDDAWRTGRTQLLVPVMTCTPAYYGMIHGVEAALGRRPELVFVDVLRDGTMDQVATARHLDEHSERVLGLVPTTLYGNYPDMAAFVSMATEHDVVLMHDDAQGGGAILDGPHAEVASVSAHGHAKTTPSGEGGLNLTSDPKLAARLRALTDCGHGPRKLDPIPIDPSLRPIIAPNVRLAEHPSALMLAQILRALTQGLQARENRRWLQERLAAATHPLFWNPPFADEYPPFYKLQLECLPACEEELGITPAGMRRILTMFGLVETEPPFVPAHQEAIWAGYEQADEYPAAERYYDRGILSHTRYLRHPRFTTWWEEILERLERDRAPLRRWLADQPSDVDLLHQVKGL